MTGAEKRLLTVSLTLLCFRATEGKLHSFDSQTTTTVAVALLFLPGIGVMDWKKAKALIPWGTVVLFGDGIGLATALLQTAPSPHYAGIKPEVSSTRVRKHALVDKFRSRILRYCD